MFLRGKREGKEREGRVTGRERVGGGERGDRSAPGRRAAEPLRTQDPRPGGTPALRPASRAGPGRGAGRGEGKGPGRRWGRGGGRGAAAARPSPPERGSPAATSRLRARGPGGPRLHAARPCCNRRRAQVPRLPKSVVPAFRLTRSWNPAC